VKKILVIEDNQDNMDLIEAFLEDEYELIKAYDGESGFATACENDMDLILLDISLPNMDGTEVIQKIRDTENIKNTPVIALTAHAMLGDREKFLKYGFDEYMSKPIVDEDELIDLIEELLNKGEN
jgi:two-component system cell cycle response regulator DivK